MTENTEIISKGKQKYYSGQYGIVLLPELSTAEEAVKLAGGYSNNSVKLGTEHKPHLTLFHTKVSELPDMFVSSLLSEIQNYLPTIVRLDEVSVYAQKFLFWNALFSGNLLLMHNKALSLSKYFQPAGIQQAEKENLKLSPDEEYNVKKYGHPLVGDLWQPHVTLGYFLGGIGAESKATCFNGCFTRVALVEVGDFGTIKDIVVDNNLSPVFN